MRDGNRRTYEHVAVAVLCIHLCGVLPAMGAPATVSIDPGVTYQTIEGIGLCSPPMQMYTVYNGPFPQEAPWLPFADTLINYAGLSFSRGFDTRACDFCPSPGEYNVDAVRSLLERRRDLQRIADSCNEVFRFTPNVFSPAPWMKRNNSCHSAGGYSTYPTDPTNSLQSAHYADFGAMCSAFVRICIDSFNVPVYALSFQNEPYFNTPYASCTYRDGAHYAEMLQVAAPAVRRASPSTLFYGTEEMTRNFPSWELAVLRNEAAAPYLDRFAVHGHPRTTRIDTMAEYNLRTNHGRPLWQSEFNWQTLDYDSSFGLVAAMLHRLGDGGNMQGFISGGRCNLWEGAGNTGGGIGGKKTFGFHFICQLMRFVRPGMTRVKAWSDVPLLRTIAFHNEERGSFSVVLLNGTAQDLEVTLNSTGTIPDSLEMRTTSSTQRFVEGAVQNRSSPVTVPPRGIVSLGFRIRGRQPSSTTEPVASVSVPRARAVAQGATRLFDLRGRALNRVAQKPTTRQSPSVVVRRDASGVASVAVRSATTSRVMNR